MQNSNNDDENNNQQIIAFENQPEILNQLEKTDS